eukprot:Tamp_14725.p1 GENE.Tamp_14725~~Tamp_14725.p1  ORF type:complete len:340 (+),score=80.72 Tamp_14725:434-1453(+)
MKDQQIEFWAAETAEQHQDFLQKLREQGRTGLANRGEDATGRENAAWWLQWLEWESLWAHESEHHEGHVNNSLRPQPTLPLQASVCQPVTLSHPPAAVVFVCCQTKRGDRCCLDVVQQHGGKEGDRVKKKLLARKDAEIAGLLARLASAEARCQDKQALEEVRGAAEAGAERMHEEIAGLEHEDEDLKRQQATGSDMQGELGGLLQRAQEPIWSFAKDLEEAQVLARAAHGGKEECEVEVQRMRKEIAGLEQESDLIVSSSSAWFSVYVKGERERERESRRERGSFLGNNVLFDCLLIISMGQCACLSLVHVCVCVCVCLCVCACVLRYLVTGKCAQGV